MATEPTRVTKTDKPKRKPPTRREGERYRITMTKGDAKLSFAVSPSATGYTLRARNRGAVGPAKLAAEHFSESQFKDSFSAAKMRAEELAKAAKAKGWTEKKSHRSIEDLF